MNLLLNFKNVIMVFFKWIIGRLKQFNLSFNDINNSHNRFRILNRKNAAKTKNIYSYYNRNYFSLFFSCIKNNYLTSICSLIVFLVSLVCPSIPYGCKNDNHPGNPTRTNASHRFSLILRSRVDGYRRNIMFHAPT